MGEEWEKPPEAKAPRGARKGNGRQRGSCYGGKKCMVVILGAASVALDAGADACGGAAVVSVPGVAVLLLLLPVLLLVLVSR
eukprot:15439605-Alexandrium_andersonii.AAC.1